MKSIEVIIATDGAVAIEAIGFKGRACETATAELEQALGKTKTKLKKPEYHASNLAQQKAGAS